MGVKIYLQKNSICKLSQTTRSWLLWPALLFSNTCGSAATGTNNRQDQTALPVRKKHLSHPLNTTSLKLPRSLHGAPQEHPKRPPKRPARALPKTCPCAVPPTRRKRSLAVHFITAREPPTLQAPHDGQRPSTTPRIATSIVDTTLERCPQCYHRSTILICNRYDAQLVSPIYTYKENPFLKKTITGHRA